MKLTNLPDFSAFCPSIQLSLNVSAFALYLFPFFLQTCTLRKGRTIIISSRSDIFCIRYLKSMTITDHREVKQKWMTWACPLRSRYIEINYTRNSLGAISHQTVLTCKIWGRYLVMSNIFQTKMCCFKFTFQISNLSNILLRSMKLSPFSPVGRESHCYGGMDVFQRKIYKE